MSPSVFLFVPLHLSLYGNLLAVILFSLHSSSLPIFLALTLALMSLSSSLFFSPNCLSCSLFHTISFSLFLSFYDLLSLNITSFLPIYFLHYFYPSCSLDRHLFTEINVFVSLCFLVVRLESSFPGHT